MKMKYLVSLKDCAEQVHSTNVQICIVVYFLGTVISTCTVMKIAMPET